MTSIHPRDPGEGDTIGGLYRLGAVLGRGGHGVVYEAKQLPLGHDVAIKMLLAEAVFTDGSVERFVREAKLAQQLTHPNTIRMIDFGQTEDGLPFIVWELLRGRTLAQEIATGPLTAARAGHIAVQVLKSLREAHARGIVHRDIKPENVFLTDHPSVQDFVKVLDFGVARPIAAGDGVRKITRYGQMIGTPSYMAPEQVRGEALGPGTDIYALGLVMAEAISGECLVQGESAIRVWTSQASDEPVSLPDVVLHSPLGAVIARATKKPITERYGSCEAMIVEVERAMSTSTIRIEPRAGSRRRAQSTVRMDGGPLLPPSPPPPPHEGGSPPSFVPPPIAVPPPMSPQPSPKVKTALSGLVLSVVVGFVIVAVLAGALVALSLRGKAYVRPNARPISPSSASGSD